MSKVNDGIQKLCRRNEMCTTDSSQKHTAFKLMAQFSGTHS